MEYYSSSTALSTECNSTESGWTNYIGDQVDDDGTESDDSLTSDARSSSPPPSTRFHHNNQHSDDDQLQHKFRVKFTSSVTKNIKLFQKQLVTNKSMNQTCNNVTNFNKQPNHQEEEEDDEQLMKYQQSYRTTVCSTTDAYNYGYNRAQNP